MVIRAKNGKVDKGIPSCIRNPDDTIAPWLQYDSRTDKNSREAESQSFGVCTWGKPDGRVIGQDDAGLLILTNYTVVCLS